MKMRSFLILLFLGTPLLAEPNRPEVVLDVTNRLIQYWQNIRSEASDQSPEKIIRDFMHDPAGRVIYTKNVTLDEYEAAVKDVNEFEDGSLKFPLFTIQQYKEEIGKDSALIKDFEKAVENLPSSQHSCQTKAKRQDCRRIENYPDQLGIKDPSKRSFALCSRLGWELFSPDYKKLNLCGSREKQDLKLRKNQDSNSFAGLTPASQYQQGNVNLNQPNDSPKFKDAVNIKSKILKIGNEVKEQTARRCCGQDNVCQQAIKSVPILWCSSQAEKNQKDSCLDDLAFFLPSEEDIKQTRQVLGNEYDREFKVHPTEPRLKKIRGLIPNFFITQGQGKGSSFPRVGIVKLSPYFNPSNSEDELLRLRKSLTHELAHSCDFIQQQLQAKAYDKESEGAYRATITLVEYTLNPLAGKCDLSTERKSYYKNLFEQAGDSAQVIKCVMDVVEESGNQNSPFSCDNGCKKRQISEAFAEAVEIKNSQIDLNADSHCRGNRNSSHPATIDLLECYANHSEDFRAKLRKDARCD